MSATRMSAVSIATTVLLLAAGTWLWIGHARAWDLGRGSPVLGYDAAEYAVAARELAEHGRLATLYALPIELARHAPPPWPLALVQPGLVVAEAALFRIVPGAPEWLALVLPFGCFLGCGILLAAAARGVLARHAPGTAPVLREGAACLVAALFLLDPEAQHLATGGFTELPFALGLIAALAGIALEIAPRRPLAFGLLLGVTGAFRGNMLWLSPLLAFAAAACTPRQRARVFLVIMLGYGLPLLPWWLYKWRSFGTPAWDLSALSLWDGIGGRTWFSLNHLPEIPTVPHGAAAAAAIAGKIGRNLTTVLRHLASGPRPLWIGSLLVLALLARPPRALAAAAAAAVAMLALGVVVAAASVPQPRYVFPTRVVLDAAGLLAAWSLIARAPATLIGPVMRRALVVVVAVLGLGWGVWMTARGRSEARAGAGSRGIPSAASLRELAAMLNRDSPAGEPVMSNLGPVLAWYARRPVVHLALGPGDIEACRRRLDTRHVLLVFRDASRAWPEWTEVFARPADAAHTREWNIANVARFQTRDGFQVLRLELGVLEPSMAARTPEARSHRR